MSLSIVQPAVDTADVSMPSPWRDIAVALTETSGDAVALELAGSLAHQYGAQLNVLQLVVMPTPLIDAWALIPDPGFAQVYTDLRQAARVRAEQLRHQLLTMQVAGEVRTLEALFVDPSQLAAEAARCTDLIVLARPCDSTVDIVMVHSYFAALLQASGRPVLVVPSFERPLFPARHAMVAWADTPESTRALHDALPLLEQCESVDVVLVDPIASVLEAVHERGESVAHHLREHGVRAQVVTVKSRGMSVGNTLLEHARQSNAQLIVSGGYGHSKVREWVIGGTTRDLFQGAQVPVLFSH
jgi:nucleotide-binding universal stress UspA family protein